MHKRVVFLDELNDGSQREDIDNLLCHEEEATVDLSYDQLSYNNE